MIYTADMANKDASEYNTNSDKMAEVFERIKEDALKGKYSCRLVLDKEEHSNTATTLRSLGYNVNRYNNANPDKIMLVVDWSDTTRYDV